MQDELQLFHVWIFQPNGVPAAILGRILGRIEMYGPSDTDPVYGWPDNIRLHGAAAGAGRCRSACGAKRQSDDAKRNSRADAASII
ncbi:hypothetical protein PsJ27TS7_41420 [Paenibacillus dendritiformis]